MTDAEVHPAPAELGKRKKQPDTDLKVAALVEEWRLARRAGDRAGARLLAAKVDKARQRAQRRQ